MGFIFSVFSKVDFTKKNFDFTFDYRESFDEGMGRRARRAVPKIHDMKNVGQIILNKFPIFLALFLSNILLDLIL